MKRELALLLSQVAPTPATLREVAHEDRPASSIEVNLGELFQHYYFDSYPSAPPCPDPSRFEYLDLLAPSTDFRFLAHVADASTTKKRGMSTDLGQAFCRWCLAAHFGIKYFAHMSRVLDKGNSAAFEGIKVERIIRGDVPDYLCARKVTEPLIAEAKGRFTSIAFGSTEFKKWRAQFSRVRVRDLRGLTARVKGYIVGTRLVTEATPHAKPALYLEDPETPGDRNFEGDDGSALRRVVVAFHYAGIFRKLDLPIVAAALENGGSLTGDLRFQLPIWRCVAPPFSGVEFVGGFYRTRSGTLPSLTDTGWQMPLELGQGHAVFVGLQVEIASRLFQAARGNLDVLDNLPEIEPAGTWSSEFSWLSDGSVLAPLTYFRPVGFTAI